MNPRADRGNRAALTLIGLLLAAAGGLGLALSYGAFGLGRAKRPVLTSAERDFVHRNSGWFWIVVAVVSILLAVAALRWLLRQVGTDRVGDLPLETDPSQGETTLHAGALTSAVSEEIEGYRGVRHAAARLLRDSRNPDLVLSVAVNERADLATLRRRIEEHAVANVRRAAGRESMPVRLQLRLEPTARQRVG